jgi:hypothetical protein
LVLTTAQLALRHRRLHLNLDVVAGHGLVCDELDLEIDAVVTFRKIAEDPDVAQLIEKEAIAIANSTRYGLASYIQTNDITRAHRIAAELDAGEVLVNGAANVTVHRPFGGFGISGLGKEGGRVGFEEFLQIKTVAIAVR